MSGHAAPAPHPSSRVGAPASPASTPSASPLVVETSARHRVNRRAVWILLALGVLSASLSAALWWYQTNRGPAAWTREAERLLERRDASRDARLAAAAERREANRAPTPEERRDEAAARAEEARLAQIALGYLLKVVERRPRDPDATARVASLLRESIRSAEDLLQARKAHENAILAAPDAPDRQELRRHAVTLNLAARVPAAALNHARELLRRGADDADAHRLLAEALEAGARVREAAELAPAVEAYETALQRDPGDPRVVEKLAAIREDVLQDPQSARRALDALLEAARKPRPADAGPDDDQPGSDSETLRTPGADTPAFAQTFEQPSDEPLDREVAARLVRYRHASRRDRVEEARAEVEAALQLAPDNIEVRLAAAESALALGRPERALRQLDALPPDDRRGSWYLFLRGRALHEMGDADAALEVWRRGLEIAGGADPNLTFQTALVLLRQGRLAEAEPLVAQYHRVTWDARSREPSIPAIYLRAVADLKTNRPDTAARALESIRYKAPRDLHNQLHNALGQAYERLNRFNDALDAYAEACRAAPARPDAWIARARMLAATDPLRAIAVLEEGLNQSEGDETLMVALAEILRVQRRKEFLDPAVRNAVERASTLAARVAGSADAPGLVLVNAERAATAGDLAAAETLLREALRARPQHPRLRIALAETLVRLERLDDALEALRAPEIPTNPDPDAPADPRTEADLAAWRREEIPLRAARARVLARLGRNQEARRALVDDLDELSPRDRAEAWRLLSELASEEWGDLEIAREAAEQWTERAPEDTAAHARVLELALEARDIVAARVATRELERLDGGGHYGKLLRVWEILLDPAADPDPALERKRAEDAVALLDAVAEARADIGVLWNVRGSLLERLERLPEAAEAYERGLQRGAGPTALVNLVRLRVRQKAFDQLDELAKRHPAQELAILKGAAETAAAVGDPALARAKADAYVKAAPPSPVNQLWYADILERADAHAEAERVLRDLVAERPVETAPWLALLNFLVRRGADASTLDDTLRKAVARVNGDGTPANPGNPAAPPHLFEAQCRVVVGDAERAGRLYWAAANARPADPLVAVETVKYFEFANRADLAERVLRAFLEASRAEAKSANPNANPNPNASGPIAASAPAPRWATRKLAGILAAKPFDIDAWNEAHRLVTEDAAVSDTYQDRLVRAQVLLKGPRPEHRRAAEALLEELARSSPSDSAVRALLAQLYDDTGRPEAALPHAREVARSGAPRQLASYAGLLLRIGKIDDAEAVLETLRRTAPDALPTLELETRIDQARNRPREAAERLAPLVDQALAAALPDSANPERTNPGSNPADPALERAVALLTLLARVAPPEEIEARAARLAEARPAEAAARLAMLLATLGRVETGLQLCRTGLPEIVRAPAEAADLANRARAALALATNPRARAEDLRIAEQLVRQARAALPQNQSLIQAEAFLRHHQREYDREIALYQSLLDLPNPPADKRFLNNMAWTLSENLGRPEEGLARVDEAIAKLGWNRQFLDTRGVVLTRLKRYPEAVRTLAEAAQADPAPEVLYHLARAQYLAGDTPAAKQTWTRARDAGVSVDHVQTEERDDFLRLKQILENL